MAVLTTTEAARRPWIAVMDLSVTKNSPAGSCVLAEVMGLADDYDITVFSDAFDNGRPERVRWVRIPLPKKPGILRYVIFHLLAPILLRHHARERGQPPRFIQGTQGQYVGADICYAHFCHRAYLRDRWGLQNATGLRRLLRWLVYQYNAYFEARAFRRARVVVAPSAGLVRELVDTYPFLEGRALANPNPVDVAAFARPTDFDRAGQLRALGLTTGEPVLCFAALGDFSRKGLALVLEAMAGVVSSAPALVVVGGSPGEVVEYKRLANSLGLQDRVAFTGFQRDVRPYFWAADLFVFPSSYETFALVVLQAMAAGMPAITTRLHGVEDYAVEGENAWIVDREVNAIRLAIQRVMDDPSRLRRAAVAAARTVAAYDTPGFVGRWRELLAKFAA
jgi:glycosyltransferase involved in cell wall biosynthesis